jgi:hypothetical protein
MLPAAAPGQSIDRILAAAAQRNAARNCTPAKSDEIVVCAHDDDARFRLPPSTPDDPRATGAVAGEAPRASVANPFNKGCGVFARQNRCSKQESRAYGYGGGHDPVTLVGRLIRKAVDPDAEVGPPPPGLPPR